MNQQRNADVVVPILFADAALVDRMRRILVLGGAALRRLILVDDGRLSGAPELALAEFALDPRVQRIHGAGEEGWVELCNLGLRARTGDVVVVAAEVDVDEGWLAVLAEAAFTEERVALTRAVEAGACSLREDDSQRRRALGGLPSRTSIPRAGIDCNYLRGEALDAVGLFDATFKTASAALDDWVCRAAAVGFFANQANHALVHTTARADASRAGAPADRAILDSRHHQFTDHVARFERTLEGSLTRHVIDLQATGRLRVALDLRHLPMEQNGTKMYAVCLGRALAALPQIDLTLIAAHPIQAEGVPGRLVHPDAWEDDVAVVHKPAQIFDRRHARLLFESRAHVFITYQDLIAYRTPGVFPTEDDFNSYRNTSRLTLQAAQGILAYSQCTAREIADEFALPLDEISPIFLGVDLDSFGTPVDDPDQLKRRLGLPSRYFLSLAGDYPHKNTLGLLEAYSEFRCGWKYGEPPALVLAGNAPVVTATARDQPGVHCLGVVSAEDLSALYQAAEALVFASLYEGFGLPPLEAMAAGSAVVAMPFSSVPEVCGDAALYSEGLGHADLARAMERVAADPELRTELVARGRRRIETLRWEGTARATYKAYRKAVIQPSERSLQMRRFLSEAIIRWSEPSEVVFVQPAPIPRPAPDEPTWIPEVVFTEPEPPAVVEAPEPEPSHADEVAEIEPSPPDEGGDEHAVEPTESIAISLEPDPAPEPSQAEPLGIINACCALREAVGRRVRKDVGHLRNAQRLRVLRASRLSRRFVEVLRNDGLAVALVKTRRKLAVKLRAVPTPRHG